MREYVRVHVWLRVEGTRSPLPLCESGCRYVGPRAVAVACDMNTIPVFAKEGAVVPLDAPRKHSREVVAEPITFLVFPGPEGHLDLYGDDQDTTAYKAPGAGCACTGAAHLVPRCSQALLCARRGRPTRARPCGQC